MNKLSKIDVFSLALGSIIGWGAFMLPGSKFLKEAGIINTMLGLILGALAIIIIEKSYKRMFCNHNDNGGEFSYVYKELGEKHAFSCGWFLSLAYLSIIPLNATAFPLVINKVFNNRLKVGLLYEISGYQVFLGEIIVSSLIILAFVLLNIRGLQKTAKIQSMITIFLIIFIFIISIGMFYKVDSSVLLNSYIINDNISIVKIFKIFAITPWAFIGFDSIPQLTQNFSFNTKKASSIAILSIIFATIIYNLLNIITGLVYSPNALDLVEWPTGMAVLNSLGWSFFGILVLALVLAVWGGINGFIISTNKLITSMAEYKVLPKVFLNTNKYNENQNTIIFIAFISLIAPWFGREVLTWIVDMSSIGASIAYAYVCYVMFKKSSAKKDKINGIIGLLLSMLFILLLLIPGSPAVLKKESLIMLIIWSCLGISYYIYKNREFYTKLNESTN